ncbi:hypothetical protein BV898_18520 [Hypsibius exemplaris]|uniref:Uncharacterized protein n=1 Tax=Hypsibius exemplaris TaxID=2072580 RepID=A0A9X6NJF5_HYPEX|nr:hypothetical protein BV898_18520 [Hypsibius exemplaris]
MRTDIAPKLEHNAQFHGPDDPHKSVLSSFFLLQSETCYKSSLKEEVAKMRLSIAFSQAVSLIICLQLSDAKLPDGYQGLPATQKQEILWEQISGSPYPMDNLPTVMPGTFAMANLLRSEYDKVSFTQVSDEMPTGRTKLIHVYGSTAQVELKIFDNSTYTGIFKSGGIGLARLSLAKEDYENYTPGMGLKILIDGQQSQNLQVMWSVDGQGTNKNFFHNTFSNIIPPPQSFALKVLSKAFDGAIEMLPGTTQDRPESNHNLPLYEQASVTRDGQPVEKVVAPYQVNFIPNPAAGWDPANTQDVRVNLNAIPEGTVLYTLTAKRTSTATEEVIGQLITKSPFVASAYEDATLFFQHAAKRWRS